MFAAVEHLSEGLSLEVFLASEIEKSVICLVRTREQTVSTTKQQSILSLRALMRVTLPEFVFWNGAF
jgi:hypothetical protein